jgi:hypothetical protein
VSIKSVLGNNGEKKNLGAVLKIFEASNSNIWIATERGLFFYDRKSWTYYSDYENADFFIKDIIEDHDGNIWLILEKNNITNSIGELGFFVVEGKMQMFNGSQWFDFPAMIGGSAAVVTGAPKEYFTSHMFDDKSNLWVSSLDGLYKYDGRKWVEFNEEDLSSDRCFDVIQTSNNEIWTATKHGIAKRVSEEWLKFEKGKGIKDCEVYNLYEDDVKRLWALSRKDNSFKSILLFEKGKWKPFFSKDLHIKGNIDNVFSLKDKLLISSPKGISVYSEKKWDNIDDKLDNIELIKKIGNDIYFLNKFKLFKFTDNGLEVLYTNPEKWNPTCLFPDKEERLWLGTDRDGLFVFENDKFVKHYNVGDGLPDNHITQIAEDKKSNIWIVGRNGINVFVE